MTDIGDLEDVETEAVLRRSEEIRRSARAKRWANVNLEYSISNKTKSMFQPQGNKGQNAVSYPTGLLYMLNYDMQ